MRRDGFVTAGMCRIKDQFADTARNMTDGPLEKGTETQGRPVSVFAGLSEETARALRGRVQEYEHFRQDLTFRLHELSSKVEKQTLELEKNEDVLRRMKAGLTTLQEQVEKQTVPDEFSEDFQIRLSENCRELERFRIDLIEIQAQLPETPGVQSQAEQNLFADLDSITFGQLFRIGAALLLPLILALVFGGILMALAIFLTFRVNL